MAIIVRRSPANKENKTTEHYEALCFIVSFHESEAQQERSHEVSALSDCAIYMFIVEILMMITWLKICITSKISKYILSLTFFLKETAKFNAG